MKHSTDKENELTELFGNLQIHDRKLLKVLKYLNQQKIESFSSVLSAYEFNSKIGEATFSEVYSVNSSKFVAKVIPFGSDESVLVNGFPQQHIENVFQEIYINVKLDKLAKSPRNFSFVQFDRAIICKGCYPQELLKLWDEYNKSGKSENDRPGISRVILDYFGKNQLFAVIVLSNGGTDLEHYKFDSVKQAESMIVQLVMSLAAAERVYEFEHRDLHWGNILLKRTEHSKLEYSLNSTQLCNCDTNGIQATIIDFTLSRMKSEQSGQIHHVKLDDPAYFEGEGDYQFEIYRLMKELLNDEWSKSDLKTNILWLHYLLDKLTNNKKLYRKVTRSDLEELAKLKERILEFPSSCKLMYDPFIKSRLKFTKKQL